MTTSGTHVLSYFNVLVEKGRKVRVSARDVSTRSKPECTLDASLSVGMTEEAVAACRHRPPQSGVVKTDLLANCHRGEPRAPPLIGCYQGMEQPPKRPDGEAVMFSGTDADWVADIQALAYVGVSAVDVRLFSCGPNQSLEATTCAASCDGVLARL